jgi:hypothetical protein
MAEYKQPKKVPSVVVGEEPAKETMRKQVVSVANTRSQDYPPTKTSGIKMRGTGCGNQRRDVAGANGVNYSQLVTAIQSYTENQFPAVYLADGSTESSTAQINRFIEQAEQRIYNMIQFPSLRKNQYTPITSSNKYVSLPNDFLAVYSLALVTGVTGGDLDTGTFEYLLNKDVNFIRQAYPAPNDKGVPKYYALFGPTIVSSAITNELSLILGPTPDAAYYVELHYYYYPESITTATTTWLGDNFDSVLLYGSLVEAYTFMKGEQDIISLYDTKFKEALALAKRLGDGMERQDAYRSGQFRQAVT